MNDSHYEEIKLLSLIKTVKVLKILWFIGLGLGLLALIIFIISIGGGVLALITVATIMFVIILGLGIATLVIQIITIVKAGSIDPRFQNVSSGTGKILLIVGIFISILTIVGAFILQNEAEKALEQLKNEQSNLSEQNISN